MSSKSQFEEIVAELQAADPRVSLGQMFGMPTVKVGTKAAAGLFNDDLVFKLSGSDHAGALALAGAKLFDPMGGRPMKEWVQVSAEHKDEWLRLAQAAVNYVASQAR